MFPKKTIQLTLLLLLLFNFVFSQSISGIFEFPITNSSCSTSGICCDYPPNTSLVANVNISAENLITGATDNGVSNSSGEFTIDVGYGTIKLVPQLNDPNWINGVSTLDLIRIQQYILGTDNMACAFRRIAADVDYDSDIDMDDRDEIQSLILGHISSLSEVPNWRSVPKNVVDDYSLHPSFPKMDAEFWEPTDFFPFGDNPFFASFNFNGNGGLVYKGDLSFADKLDYWPNPSDQLGVQDCLENIPMGFYIFKSGDVSGNASTNFTPSIQSAKSKQIKSIAVNYHTFEPTIETRSEETKVELVRSYARI